jgi:prepilin peptidase CpaA
LGTEIEEEGTQLNANLLMSTMPSWITWLYLAIGALAAITDYRNNKIYNWLTLPTLVFGLVFAAVMSLSAFLSALKGVAVAAAIFIPLFAFGIMGGGDVKLMMAFGAVLGPQGALELTYASTLISAFGAVTLLIRHKRVRAFFEQLWFFFRSLVVPGLETQWPKLDRKIKAPFGIAIFCGFAYLVARQQ